MLPLHCKQCGRLIGKSEKREFEGKTVCLRCFDKLGGNETTLTPKQSAFYIAVILAAIFVIMLLLWLFLRWALAD